MKNGLAIHDWIDAQTFLEAKIEGQPRRLDGVYHPVEVYYRDYRPVSGLQIPHILETKVLQVAGTAKGFKDPPVPAEKITIEKVVVNPKLDENLFSKTRNRGCTEYQVGCGGGLTCNLAPLSIRSLAKANSGK